MAGRRVGLVLGLIAVVFLQQTAAQTVHVVGDGTGWTNQITSPSFYADWAATRTFVVGDSLQFNFPTNAHDVLELDTKQSFDSCAFNNNDNDIKRTGPVTEMLEEPGMHYFVCTIGSHCSMGQKLAINVSATAGGPPTSPSSPRPPASTPSPPTSTPSTPSTPSSPTPPSPSSSNAVMASLCVTLLSAIVMGLFYV